MNHRRRRQQKDRHQQSHAAAARAAVARRGSWRGGEPQNSNYVKIRTILRDLRVSFIEVLRAPNFQNCQAAHDILRQMKLMIGLSKQLSLETTPSRKHKKPTKGWYFAGECEEPVEKCRKEEKQVEQPKFDKTPNVPSNINEVVPQPECVPNVWDQVLKVLDSSGKVPEKSSEAKDLEKKQLRGLPGTYIVGGSPVGWNFIVYPSSKPVYYGVSKSTARSRPAAGPLVAQYSVRYYFPTDIGNHPLLFENSSIDSP